MFGEDFTIKKRIRPAGVIGEIQFNSGGRFGSDAHLFWDNINKRLGIGTSNPDSKLQVVGGSRFGEDTANYSEFESDGTYIAKGDSTTWDDIVGSLIALRLESVVGKLQYNYDENSITMQSGGSISTSADRLIFNYQYPHSAITNGEMRLHIHWEQIDSTAREFTVEYRIQNNGSAKTTSWTQVVVNSNTNNKYTYTAGTLNQITELVAVDMTGAGLSATVQFRLARTDTETGDIEATFVDAHVEKNMMGSRQEYVK